MTHATTTPPTIQDLTDEQADGTACVVCGQPFAVGETSVPVGRSDTGSQVFAHTEQCAATLPVGGAR
jgi:hypothetical protein